MDATKFVIEVVGQLAGVKPEVSEAKDVDGVVIDVKVRGSIPHVIGKDGKTIEAIRTIAKALGSDGNHRVQVRVNDGHES